MVALRRAVVGRLGIQHLGAKFDTFEVSEPSTTPWPASPSAQRRNVKRDYLSWKKLIVDRSPVQRAVYGIWHEVVLPYCIADTKSPGTWEDLKQTVVLSLLRRSLT